MTIRKLTTKDAVAMKDILHYCFYNSQSWDEEDWEKFFSFLDYDGCFGYFIDKELASTYVVYPCQIFIRGKLMKVGGIASVATKPQYRRQKQITALTEFTLKEMRAKKQIISILYPFKYSYYRMFGWENCVEFNWIISPPANILIPNDFKRLDIKEISHNDAHKIIRPIREKFGKKFTIMLFDDPELFKLQFLDKQNKVLVLKEEGRNVGYFITKLEKREGEWNIRFNLRDVLVDSINARFTVFEYIKKHTDQNKDFSYPLMGDENVTDYFDLWEGKFTCKKTGGAMFRVVDVEKALEILEFDTKLEVTFVKKLEDKYALWNSESMKIEISNGKATTTRNLKQEVNFDADIKAFTQLFTGYRSIHELIEIGKIHIKKLDLELLDQAFPKQLTRIRTFF